MIDMVTWPYPAKSLIKILMAQEIIAFLQNPREIIS